MLSTLTAAQRGIVRELMAAVARGESGAASILADYLKDCGILR